MNELVAPLVGGALIGLGSLITIAASGKVPGISGIVAKVIRPKSGDWFWRLAFLLGLIVGAGITFAADASFREFEMPGGRPAVVIALAGLLVGFGTRMGGGCTSGHGVCGIGTGAKDAVVYTIAFMVSGILTVWIWNLALAG